jgi:nicotinamide-nucleotide amidase
MTPIDVGVLTEAELLRRAEALLERCRQRKLKLATAESCTGGLVAATLVAIAGSSDVLDRGFVTYSNDAKHEMLGVPWPVLLGYGAVSEPTVRAMAQGALAASHADLAVSISGIAGPGGGTAEKPVGLVHIGAQRRGGAQIAEHRVPPGDRTAIRVASVALAFDMLERLISD